MNEELFPKTDTIRMLWWRQPFASLMLHGKIETRNRPTQVRGKVLICATIKPYSLIELGELMGANTIQNMQDEDPEWISKLPNGLAIGVGELVHCRRMKSSDEDKCFIRYRDNLWCWVFENVQPIKPFKVTGKQGWAIADEEIKSKITYTGYKPENTLLFNE